MAFGSMQTQQGLLCVIPNCAPESVADRGSGGVDDVGKCCGSHLAEDPSPISRLDAQRRERAEPQAGGRGAHERLLLVGRGIATSFFSSSSEMKLASAASLLAIKVLAVFRSFGFETLSVWTPSVEAISLEAPAAVGVGVPSSGTLDAWTTAACCLVTGAIAREKVVD